MLELKMDEYMAAKPSRIVLKVFDERLGGEKRLHTCSTCHAYKREIKKGNPEALEFYKQHINELARRQNGVTIDVTGYAAHSPKVLQVRN